MLTLEERNTLIADNIVFAERIASVQSKKIPFYVQWDEVKSAAYMGLVKAAHKYDGTIPFGAYANIRICGEIKDYLRGLSWGPRGSDKKVVSWDDGFDYAAEPESEDTTIWFEELTAELSPLVKRVMKLYYLEENTMKQVGDKVGLSATRIYQMIQSGLEIMRKS